MVAVAPTPDARSQVSPSYLVEVMFRTVVGTPTGFTKVRAVTARLPRNPRSDARDNRARILDAARSAFVTDGLDVPIREIARRAEIGPATVYRHFPTKEVLAAEAFTSQLLTWRAALNEGLADPDPWRGFCHTVEKLCRLQTRDRGFTAAFKSTFPRAIDFAANRASSLASAAELVRRARDAGRLRADVGLNDLILMITASGGIHAATPAARIAASQRFAALMIQAFQTSPVTWPRPATTSRSQRELRPSRPVRERGT
jgi:AcrR family transcriptional regulator